MTSTTRRRFIRLRNHAPEVVMIAFGLMSGLAGLAMMIR